MIPLNIKAYFPIYTFLFILKVLYIFFCFERQPYSVVQDSLDLTALLLPQPSECQDNRHEPSYLSYITPSMVISSKDMKIKKFLITTIFLLHRVTVMSEARL